MCPLHIWQNTIKINMMSHPTRHFEQVKVYMAVVQINRSGKTVQVVGDLSTATITDEGVQTGLVRF